MAIQLTGDTLGHNSDTDIATVAAQSLALANDVDFNVAKAGGFQYAGTAVTATAAELNYLDKTTAGDSAADKAIVCDGNGDFEMQDSDKIFFGDGADVSIHWDGSTMKIGTDTSGAPITIGHSTSEVTIADNLTVKGNLFISGSLTSIDSSTIAITSSFTFEGAGGDDAHETKLNVVKPTADATISLPAMSAGTYYLPVLAAASTTSVTSTPEELNLLDGSSAGTVVNSKAVIYSSDGDVVVGDNLTLDSDAAVIQLGDDQEVTLTHVHDTGLLLNSDMQLQFRDSAVYVNSDADGSLQARADTSIDLNINGTDVCNVTSAGLNVDGTLTGNTSLTLDTTTISTAEIAVLDSVTAGTAAASKAVVLDGSKNIATIGTIGCGAITSTGASTFGSVSPSSADGGALGGASAEWSDLYLADGGVVYFGNDQDVALTHDADKGLVLSHEATADDKPVSLILRSKETAIIQNETIGKLDFQSYDGSGTDARLVCAGIEAIAANTFDADTNETTLVFKTSVSETATARVMVMPSGNFAPVASDGAALGHANYEWADLYMADGAVVYFGDDQEITLTHEADSGLILKHDASGDDKYPTLTLQAGDDDIAANDKLGVINFQAPDEGTGTDAILVAAGIEAVSEGDFSSSNNFTKLSFKTARSETAAEKMALSSVGVLTLNGSSGALVIPDGGNIGSASDTDAIAISAAGVVALSATTAASATTTAALTVAGGIGVAGDMWLGDDLVLDSDAAVVSFGDDQDVSLTHVHDTGLLLNSNMQLQFRDSNSYIYSNAANDLEIVATDITLDAATLIDLQSDAVSIGEGGDTDVVLTFNANSNDGVITWMEDEDMFQISDDVMLTTNEKLGFRDSGIYIQSSADGQLDLVADTKLNLAAPTIALSSSAQTLEFTTPHLLVQSALGTKPLVEIKCTNPDANASTLRLHMTGATPADDDALGTVQFYGGNSVGQAVEYGRIRGLSEDVADGTEDGSVTISAMVAGTVRDIAIFGDVPGNTAGLTLPNDSSYGVVKAHSFATYSDESLKTNIQPMENALDKVKSLQGVTYDWKTDGSNDIGFIAQDVEKIIPQIVRSTDKEGSYSMSYSRITALLVEGIKEQQSQIENLKKALANLKK